MFATLGFLLAVAWLFGFATMKTASIGLHLLLALAVISFIAHVMRGPATIDRSPPII